MLTDFHETSTTGFFWWDNQNEGWQLYANFKTVHFVKYLTSTLMDFHKTSINKPSFDEIIQMRGDKPMLTAKLHILLNISHPCWWIFKEFYNRPSFEEMIGMRGNSTMLISKLHILLNILASCWQICTRLL